MADAREQDSLGGKVIILILLVAALLGWAVAFHQHREISRYKASRDDVKRWSGVAYEIGYDDCGWPARRGLNKDFAVDGVLNAYDGDFK